MTNTGKKRVPRIAGHAVFWMAYTLFFAMLERQNDAWWHVVFITLFFIGPYMLASYISAYLLVPRYLFPKKYLLFAAAYIATVAIASALIYLFIYLYYRNVPELMLYMHNVRFVFYKIVWGVIFTTALFIVGKLVQQKLRGDRLNAELKAETARTELGFLKAQINPHFLFNAINSIYFLIDKDQELAKQTLLRVSDLLRYQLYECNNRYVPIEKEIEYLRNFIGLESLRRGEKVEVTARFDSLTGISVSPFLFLPFVENAFKYVSLPGQISITLTKTKNSLMFSVSNTAGRTVNDHIQGLPAGGIGIQNVKRMLELMYPGRYTLTAGPVMDQQYTATLNLKIDEDKDSNNRR